MNQIVERETSELRSRLGQQGVARLKELLISEANFHDIHRELGVSLLVCKFLSVNLPLFLRTIEEKKSSLKLVYFNKVQKAA